MARLGLPLASTYTRCCWARVNWYTTRYPAAGVSSVVLPISVTCPLHFTDLRSVADPYNPNRYQTAMIPPDGPLMVPARPRLIRQDVSHSRRGYLVKGR